jgi:hypothetical protein
VFYNGRRADVETQLNAQIGELTKAALQCHSLPFTDGETYQLIDLKSQTFCKTDEYPAGVIFVLKRARPFASDLVFTGKIAAKVQAAHLSLISKLLIADPMKSLLRELRKHNDNAMEFAQFTAPRLNELMQLYQKGELGKQQPIAELNSLFFILFGASPEPLVPRALHELALAAIDKPDDPSRCNTSIVFLMSLPFETHTALTEILATYEKTQGPARERLIVALTEFLFPESINLDQERRFVSFLLIVGPAILGLPAHGSELRIHGDTIILFDGKNKLSREGPVDVQKKGTVAFELPESYESLFMNPAVVTPLQSQEELLKCPDELIDFTTRLDKSREQVVPLLPKAVPILRFDVESLFQPV